MYPNDDWNIGMEAIEGNGSSPMTPKTLGGHLAICILPNYIGGGPNASMHVTGLVTKG